MADQPGFGDGGAFPEPGLTLGLHPGDGGPVRPSQFAALTRSPVLPLRLLPGSDLPPPPGQHASLACGRTRDRRHCAGGDRLARPVRRPARLALAIYATAVAAVAGSAARHRGHRAEGALVAAVLPTMHLAWGAGTIAGMLRFGPPTAALARQLGLRGSQAGTGGAGDVYAPSLHGETL